MRFQVILAVVASASFVVSSPLLIEAKGEYSGYGGYGSNCCSCVPTASPTTAFPTSSPSTPLAYDTICSTDGGYAVNNTLCVVDFTYKSTSSSSKRSGCQATDGKFRPYIDPKAAPSNPTRGGDITMWCPIVSVYDVKKTKSDWGYCNCREFGCLPDTASALIDQATQVYASLTQVQKQKFKSVVGSGNSPAWYPLISLDYTNSAAPICYTDGGKQSNVKCMASWTYVGAGQVKTPVTGCADTNTLKPFTTGTLTAPVISSTSKAKYCSTVPEYDPKKGSTTKESWGYCSCLSNLDISGVNGLISVYNPLSKLDRAKFWERVKSA